VQPIMMKHGQGLEGGSRRVCQTALAAGNRKKK
jgi:hypothetical protein